MSEHLEFSLKQIVWASLNQYPPWPAKIVRKSHHHDKTVYKVILFAQPTYCYLHPHSLIPFNNYQPKDQNEIQQNLKLKTAIHLAHSYLNLNSDLKLFCKPLSSTKMSQSSSCQTNFEQTDARSEQNVLPQKNQQHQNSNILKSNHISFFFDIIEPSNVLQILDCYHNGTISQTIQNFKRKQIITFQNQLKYNLLLKYKLNTIDNLNEAFKKTKVPSNNLHELRINKKLKEKPIPKFDKQQLCIRKIQKILFKKGMQRKASYQTSLKIVQEIEKRSESLKQSNSSYFTENIIQTILQISAKLQQIQETQVEYIEKSIVSFLEVQFNQNKLEEGSRMTQINEDFGV